MNLSAPFVARPVATTLLAVGLTLAGAVAFTRLPVSPLPQVDFPVISVTPAMRPRLLSSGVATVEAIVSGLAPGSCACTEIVG